jgi:hypothetical protein
MSELDAEVEPERLDRPAELGWNPTHGSAAERGTVQVRDDAAPAVTLHSSVRRTDGVGGSFLACREPVPSSAPRVLESPRGGLAKGRRAGAPLRSEAFRVSVLTPDGDERSYGLDAVVALPVSWFLPIRQPAMYRGQRHMPGLYWSATDEALLWYESRLELAVLRMLDFDPQVIGIAVQPFRLRGPGIGRPGHVPDALVQTRGGTRRVIDVSDSGRVSDPARERVHVATRSAMDIIGWEYAVTGAPPMVLGANIRWLAGYRRPLPEVDAWSETIVEACSRPRTIKHLERQLGPDPRVRPALFHLLWAGELLADLSLPLSGQTVVTRAGR